MSTLDLLNASPSRLHVDAELVARAIDALRECATACAACAGACLAEDAVAEMAGCIRDDLDCADVCTATANVLSRLNDSDRLATTSLLAACIQACVQCGSSCGAHGEHAEHCRLCADACARCEAACQALLDAIEQARA